MNEASGMSQVVSALTTSLSGDALWGIVAGVIPFLAVSVLFGLGFYLVKRIIKKTKNGKGGI